MGSAGQVRFGLYIHWPFCASKCPYCDFNSHVAAKIDQKRWAAAYRDEIRRVAAMVPDRRLTSIFFGGGTPSLMEPETVAAILEEASARWSFDPDIEVTLEANPGSVEAGRFRAYAEAGVNRLSLGVQALDDTALRQLGRMHTAAEARTAFGIARRAFGRVSFDMIYARQHQTAESWRKELQDVLSMAVDHVSLYQLTIEDGTVFGARAAAGLLRGLPDEDLAAEMYVITQEVCDRAGLPAYEISNHARPGAESRHNLVYWRADDYAGVGPGAHGRLTLPHGRISTETHLMPDMWLQAVERDGTGESNRSAISPSEQATEYLLMALRLAEGMNEDRFATLAGQPLDEEMLAVHEDAGLLVRSGGNVRATLRGRMLLNQLIASLMPSTEHESAAR